MFTVIIHWHIYCDNSLMSLTIISIKPWNDYNKLLRGLHWFRSPQPFPGITIFAAFLVRSTFKEKNLLQILFFYE